MSIYLAIDLGTTGCRSILFDENLSVLSQSYEEYGLITPKEKWVEQDANLWWELTKRTILGVKQKTGILSSQIKAIAISSQAITVVPVDENIEPLCNAISWLDTRADEECRRIQKDFSSGQIYRLTGKPLTPVYTLPKILWLKENEPQIYQKAYKLLAPLDFLVAKLTGKPVTDHSMASGTLMYDLRNACWSEEILSRFEIDKNKLPSLADSTSFAGYVKEDVREELGLSEKCVVAVGAQDQKCAAFGAGLDERSITISLGTAAAVTKLWKDVRINEKNGACWCGYVEKDCYVTEGVVETAGTCLRWVRDLLFSNESYDVINKEAAEARERGSSLLFYPYLSGSTTQFESSPQGVFYGASLATKRGDYALSVMEGVAFEIRALLENVGANEEAERIILFGGGAKSDLWCEILSDTTGLDIVVPDTVEAAGAGAAMIAALAAGDSLLALPAKRRFVPGKMRDAYNEKYRKYKVLKQKMWGI